MSSYLPPLDTREEMLGAGESISLHISGFGNVLFYDATASFAIQMNGGPIIRMTKGKAIRLRESDQVETVTLINNSSATNTIKFYYGSVQVEDFSLQVVDGFSLQSRETKPNKTENLFNGTLSSSLGQLTKVKELMVSRTQLSGTIPSEIGHLTALENLEMYGNKFTGVLPNSLGECTTLKRIDLFNNALNGTIPMSGIIANSD